jgi:hypothetical protein
MKTKSYAVPEGCKITSVDFNTGVVVYESNEPQFKKGDFIITKYKDDYGGDSYIAIVDNIRIKDNAIVYFVWYNTNTNDDNNTKIHGGVGIGCIDRENKEFTCLATPEEKQLLISKMRENGKDWDAEKCEVVDYVEMIEKGQSYFMVSCLQGQHNAQSVYNASSNRLSYRDDYFKTKELAQIACDKLNEVLSTLKHY